MSRKIKTFISLLSIAALLIQCKSQIRTMMGAKQRKDSGAEDATSQGEPIVRRFKASEERLGELQFNPLDGALNATFELEDQYVANSKILKQEAQTNVVDILQQGNPEIQRNEVFKQDELGIIDIQLVIDNSASMQQEQDRIKNSLKDLLNFISTTNWQINITTTDPGSAPGTSCSRALIRKGEANASANFEAAVDAGVMGAASEKGVLMAVEGLKCHNNQWLRKNASTAILFVSDEDNCSNGNDDDCVNQPYQTAKYLTDYLSGPMAKTVGTDARIYGIFWVPGTSCADAFNQGFIYQELVNLSKGKSGSICETDYTQVLQSISKDLNTILSYEFLLKNQPLSGTLKVFITQGTTTTETTNFIVNGRFLRFLSPPPADTTISVQYQSANPQPLTNRFKASQKPKVATLKVRVEGIELAPSDYTYDAATQEVVLNTTPKPDVDVRLDYAKDIELLNNFSLGRKAKKDSIKITQNNISTSQFTQTETDGKTFITFPEVPKPDTTLAITFLESTGPRLIYPLELSGDEIKLVSVVDADNKPLNVSIDLPSKKITISEADFKEGKSVKLQFQPKNFGVAKINLPEKIIPESYKLTPTNGTCTVKATVDTADINCTPANTAPIVVQWSYRTALQQSFTIPEVADPNVGAWQVMVNQQEISQYKRQDKTITIDTALNTSDEVQITYFSKI